LGVPAQILNAYGGFSTPIGAASPSGRWRGFPYLSSTIVKETASGSEKSEPGFALLLFSVAFIVSHDESTCCSIYTGDFCKGEKVKSIINKN